MAKVISVGGATDSTTHSFSDEEKVAFADYINNALKKDVDLKDKLPIKTDDMSLFAACKDGLLLCKLINDAVPETIDERVLNKKNLNNFRIVENQNLCIMSAKAIGCNVVNIGPQDLMEGKTHLLLGLIWQIVKIGLFSRINLVNHPELYRLLEDGETIEDLLKLPIEQILLRWFNYHLKAAGWNRRVANFTSDIKDAENYTVLLAQIAPQHCNRDGLKESNVLKRAEMVLQGADKLDCRKFVTAKDINKGHQKLNLAFVANLFNTWPALAPVEVKVVIEETREEKTYRNWMNSLGVDPFVNYLYDDLRDGVVLLELFDKISPGIVDWKRVNKNPPNTYKKLENCNYCIELGKKLNFSLVNIQGNDIMNANKTLTLALVWQMMRFNVISILNALGGGQKIADGDIIAWANKKNAANGKIGSFHDPSLKTGIFIITLIDAIRPGSAEMSLIERDGSEKSNLLNAKYAISLARKQGAVVFALPEDIVEVKNKMIMTIFAGLMAVDLGAR
jgi:dimeric dUTPase (all-alpha-NTP-PPase superfamily)